MIYITLRNYKSKYVEALNTIATLQRKLNKALENDERDPKTGRYKKRNPKK